MSARVNNPRRPALSGLIESMVDQLVEDYLHPEPARLQAPDQVRPKPLGLPELPEAA